MDEENSIMNFLNTSIVDAFPNRTILHKKITSALLEEKKGFSVRDMIVSKRLYFNNCEKAEINKVLNPHKLRLDMTNDQLDAYVTCDQENPDSKLFLDLENHGFKCSQFTTQTLKSNNIGFLSVTRMF